MIKINKMNCKVIKPSSITEMKNTLNAQQLNALDIILAKVNGDPDEANLFYGIDANELTLIMGYENEKKAVYRSIRESFQSLEHVQLDLSSEDNMINKRFIVLQETYWDRKNLYLQYMLSKSFKEFLVLQKTGISYYELKNTLILDGIYAKKLFPLLFRFSDTGNRYDKLPDLREKLNVPESYSHSKMDSRIIRPAIEEINKKTCLNIEYSYTGNSVSGGFKATNIIFIIKKEEPYKQELLSNPIVAELSKFLEKENLEKILNACNGDEKALARAYDLYKNSRGVNNMTGWMISAIKNNWQSSNNHASNMMTHSYSQEELDDIIKLKLTESSRLAQGN